MRQRSRGSLLPHSGLGFLQIPSVKKMLLNQAAKKPGFIGKKLTSIQGFFHITRAYRRFTRGEKTQCLNSRARGRVTCAHSKWVPISIFPSGKPLSSLSYPIKTEALDVNTLKETKAVPRDFSVKQVSRLYQDSYVEVAILRSDDGSKLSRSTCTRTTRMWRQNRLKRPLLLFTNGTESYAVIVPGTRTDGEAKILWLSDNLYRTDREVIDSLRFPRNPDSLRQAYDTTFFPYERVRSEFFTGYRDLYAKIEKAVKKHLKKESSSYAQRFLGRLMFVYFLQRKGWLKKDKQFINSISDYRKLNELFYESLNKEGTPGIPFLNGSLFEREEYMSTRLEKDLSKAMDPLFQKARSFFNDYNFTVDEASPLELEVSIDPALIGTVFENMLPEYERGSKGTFYTPASESSFICRRALANYLGCPDLISDDKKVFQDGLRLYIEKLREMKSEKEVRDFREKLLKTVILDPAVGSGGFLLVAMQEIILIIQEAESTVGWKSDPEEYKKRILPNLYGFDIEGEAIEIARLRLWLSLIIDQKEPEPLPNLDMNLVQIPDSLRLPDTQMTLDSTIEDLRTSFQDLKEKYLNEHDARNKKKLRDQLNKIRTDLAQKTGTDPFVIESFMPTKPNLIVMNPPYVRQEAIPEKSKTYYSDHYGLDKKSDLFAYFLVRALNLLSAEGIVSAISSDKWMETGYGLSLQLKLKGHLIAIFGQKERSFGADVNTIISICSSSSISKTVHFTYCKSYSDLEVIRETEIDKAKLAAGKWFYLRAPTVFIQHILPKLTYKLSDIAEVKTGLRTGANDFFYLKDVTNYYEADRLAGRNRTNTPVSKEELSKRGLVYVENEAGERFLLEKEVVKPVLRSIKDYESPIIESFTNRLCFVPHEQISSKFEFAKRYVKHGEDVVIEVTRGSKVARVVGYNSVPSIKPRAVWYLLPELRLGKIFLPEIFSMRFLNIYSKKPILGSDLFDIAYPLDDSLEEVLWLYLNSTIYFMTLELWSRRMGGGGGALHPKAVDYKGIPIPDIRKMKRNLESVHFGRRATMVYNEELKQPDKIELDSAVLLGMGFEVSQIENLRSSLYDAYLEQVHDRLAKAGKWAASTINEEELIVQEESEV
ncbi:MAG: Eco57I restriction-modification methylase domain-containing protein [Nitrososphaerales archaeon]